MNFCSRSVWIRATIAAFAFAGVSVDVAAQPYPNKPIQLIVPSTTGGGTDALGRVIADALAATLKQSVVVLNRPGAGGAIGSESLVRAPADGYTLLIVQNGHTMNPALFKKLPYDTFGDFTPVATLGRSPLVLVSSAATGVKSVKELTDLGKRAPDSMSFGSADASVRLATELLSGATAIPMTVINYKGTGPIATDVAGGHLNFAVTTIASTTPLKGSGKMNYLAVLAAERSSLLPEVPTLAEQGYAGMASSAWWGLVGPKGMPAPVLQKLSAAVQAALNDAEVRKRMATLSIEPWQASPDEFDKFIHSEVAQTLRLAKKAGIEAE